jgi:hypothetical protein
MSVSLPAIRGRVVAVLGAAAAVAAFVPSGGASAATSTGFTGSTTVTFGGKTVTTLTSGGCGALTATALGPARTSSTAKNQFKATFPISDVKLAGDGGLRIDHTGGLHLANACYDIGLTTFRISNFGRPNQDIQLDLTAVTHADDLSGRNVAGTLDLTNSTTSVINGRLRIGKITLAATDRGAAILNELTTGDAGSGPFAAGQQIGNAKTTIRLG